MLDEFIKHLLIDFVLLLILGAVASKLFLVLKKDLDEVKQRLSNIQNSSETAVKDVVENVEKSI